jgi:arylamine N-acetyltransferase
VLDRIRGDEAARLFLGHLGLGRRSAGPEFLQDLALGFARLPYENISKIIKSAEIEASGAMRPSEPARSLDATGHLDATRPLDGMSPLDAMRLPREVAEDHIERGFGGTCFSLTFFLERVLRSLGFDAYKVMADMNSGPNVHCLVVVNEGGKHHMLDPGYALYKVIDLPEDPDSRSSASSSASRPSRRVICPHAEVEVMSEGEQSYSLWTEDAAGRKRRYRFRDRPVSDREFETHWEDSFGKPTLNNICLTRMTDQGHIYLRKDFFKFSSRDSVDKRRLAGNIERFVKDEFGIGEEWTARAREILEGRRRTWKSMRGPDPHGGVMDREDPDCGRGA